MQAGIGMLVGRGRGREAIITTPWGLLSGPHERKRLTPLSLRKACRGPLCVCECACACVRVWLVGVCVTDGAPCYDPKSLTIFLKPSSPIPSSQLIVTQRPVYVDKQDCKKPNVAVESSCFDEDSHHS